MGNVFQNKMDRNEKLDKLIKTAPFEKLDKVDVEKETIVNLDRYS
jgi:hypothetical protein